VDNTKRRAGGPVGRCQAKFLTCEISDFTQCTYAQSNVLHTKYVDKTDH